MGAVKATEESGRAKKSVDSTLFISLEKMADDRDQRQPGHQQLNRPTFPEIGDIDTYALALRSRQFAEKSVDFERLT